MKNYLFGWTNIKWFLKETLAIFSSKPSYFSKKRIESGVAFLIAQFGMVYFLFKNIDKMDVYDICIWAATEFAVAGYMVSHIQREKKIDPSTDQIPTEEEQMNS
jgi:hypothetical protein